jgi:bifunctional polynucleotide phosphatase/kinase
MNPEKRTLLPSQAFFGYVSRYQRPELSEGFQDITEVKFQVCHPSSISFHVTFCNAKYLVKFRGTEAERALWTQHWT